MATQYMDIINECYNNNLELVIDTLITFAKICETRDEYHEESIKSYEQVLDKLKKMEIIDTIEETTVETVKKRLSRMYVTIVNGSQKKTFSLDRAPEISLETYHQYRTAFEDYPDQTLHQSDCVILLYQQVNTEESQRLMYELLEESTRYIITAAAANLTLFHAATSLATLFVNANLIQNGKRILKEMRETVIYGETLYKNGTYTVLDSQTRKAVFIFLIAFGHGLDQHNEDLSYSKTMTEIVLESFLYEEYSRIKAEESILEVVLQYGARLRRFWQDHQHKDLIEALDQDLLDRFKSAFVQYFDINCIKEVKETFYLRLMDELGKDQPAIYFEFETVILEVDNGHVKSLLNEGDFYSVNQVGQFILKFSKEKCLYHNRRRIRYGYKLAQYLVGIGAPHSDENHRAAIVETSRSIMDDVIAAFDTLEIDFQRLGSEDLRGLIDLLYAQGNSEQLDRVLYRLWVARGDIQSTFGCDIQKIVRIGTLLAHVQWAQQRYRDAVHTIRQLYYNLQRARGRLHKDTLEVSRLLANMYATMAADGEEDYFSYAMDVHHHVMREIASPSDVVYNGYTRRDRKFLTEQVRIHSSLLNSLRMQLNDSQSYYWTKREHDVREIYENLQRDFELNDNPTDSHPLLSWKYVPPKTWRFDEPELEKLQTELILEIMLY